MALQVMEKMKLIQLGGVVKIALRKAVANGEFFPSASSCVEFLQKRFGDHESPEYNIREIFPEQVQRERKSASRMKYHSIDGSSKFRVMVIEPNSNVAKAAPYICVCETCMLEYGSCSLFKVFLFIPSMFPKMKGALEVEWNLMTKMKMIKHQYMEKVKDLLQITLSLTLCVLLQLRRAAVICFISST